ncbi:IS200/IS605 family transposase [Mycobacterium paragordonae]|uniref:IS200/IS605 family transposase n=1 Tax=Mycobacterium paragordonae TaxID=1389713 RepID=A0ABQ1CGP8_9MYCO|nr:IS200/IS605 family transposase [Mycobacterium paragordonae]GFG83268.1 IS200/IS605 family transposase [Mycobacterium paragordonae]
MTTTPSYRRARHSVSLLHAHVVFVTKYRRPVFTDAMLTHCENIMRDACTELGTELVEFNGEADHVHLLVSYPPTLAVSTLVQRLKGRTAHSIRREYTGTCVRAACADTSGRRPISPSRGGAPLSIIKQYIDGQARPL